MIIGATGDTDYKILSLSENFYDKLNLKRVYYSAYIPLNNDENLPAIKEPPLLRENRLYQADWLLRFYGFNVEDLLDKNNQNFNVLLDPKADWALRNIDKFPIEINNIDYNFLIRVPGIGITSAKKIIQARKYRTLSFDDLKKMNISIKRAKYFITCNGKYFSSSKIFKKDLISSSLIFDERSEKYNNNLVQLSLFNPTKEDKLKCLTGEM
jgi:predicted DNA-binding helix-hairpin-helix protein